MHLLYATSSLPRGSAETFVITEIEALRRRGHRVTVVPARPRGGVVHAAAADLESVTRPVLALDMLAALARGLSTARGRHAARLALGGGPRTLLKNLAILPKAFWLARLMTDRGIDHAHAHFASVPATMVMVAAEIASIPWSFTAHRWDIPEDNLLARKAARAQFARFISEAGRDEALAMGVPAERTGVIRMGVELPPDAVPPARAGAPPLRVLCPAALVARKNHRVVLAAVRRLVERGLDLRLTLAGDGPLREDLEAAARAGGIADRVEFAGLVPHDRLLERYLAGGVDVVVLASDAEGIPVALMEAMAHRVPVVATAVGGVAELLADGGGVLVPPRDPAALADGIARLSEAGDRITAGRAAREAVAARHDVDRIAAELERRFAGSADHASG